jgi:hypothetical protein
VSARDKPSGKAVPRRGDLLAVVVARVSHRRGSEHPLRKEFVMSSVINTGVKVLASTVVGLVAVAGSSNVAIAGDGNPVVGEVRAMAVAWNNQQITEQMHRNGWLEARGQLLQTKMFPELYGAIGRDWTGPGADESHFALPRIQRSTQIISSDNPYGVLGPGDLVTSGRPQRTRNSVLWYWIYAGKDISTMAANAPTP